MARRRLTALLVGLLLAMGLTAPRAAAEPLVDPERWHQGAVGFNQHYACIYTCQYYFVAFTKVSAQGPTGATPAFNASDPSVFPRVRQRFYLHLYVANVYPGGAFDAERYQLRLLLPNGLGTDIRSETDVRCQITDASFNPTRDMSAAECQDPKRNGLYWEFPPVALSSGEAANFWVPVKATKTFAAGAGARIQLTANMTPNSRNLLPNPVLSDLSLRVDGALKSLVTKAPSISGSVKPGKTLTAKVDAWRPKPVKLAYQWLRDGQEIAGATRSKYQVQPADSGSRLSVRVTGSKTGYATAARVSRQTAVVPPSA